MNVRASIIAEIDTKLPCFGEWWRTQRRVLVASKPANGSHVRITVPKGPKTAETVTVEVELADLFALCRELARELPRGSA